MALAPIAHVLYTRVMEHAPTRPDWPDRDRFVLSCGHASMLLYSALHLTGYGVSLDDIKNFRQLGSPCAGHPEYGHAPGIETTTGPLGQGIATAVGLALGERMLAQRLNRPGHEIVDHRTYVIASDGDLQEGVASEACSLAGHLGLGRLICFYDDNHISIEGDTALSFSEDVPTRFEAYGWHVQNLGEDLDLDRIEAAVARRAGRRAPVADRRAHPHRARLAEQAGHPRRPRRAARRGGDQAHQGGLRLAEPRAVLHPRRGARALPRVRAARRGARGRVARALRGLPRRVPGRAPPSSSGCSRASCPSGWDADVPRKGPDAGHDRHAQGRPTRSSSGRPAQVPELVGGSADLAPSTLTLIDGGGDVERGRLRRAQPALRHPRARAWARSSTASCCTACARSAPAS